jgi:capsule polysaccharide export protein KpsE/RkpR
MRTSEEHNSLFPIFDRPTNDRAARTPDRLLSILMRLLLLLLLYYVF